MAATLVLSAATLAATFPAPPPPPPVPVRVVTPDGQPAAGAKVWTYPYQAWDDKSVPPEPAPAVTDADGRATAAGPGGIQGMRWVFARDRAGRVGSAVLGRRWEPEPGPEGATIVLAEVAERKGRVTTADGKPVAGAKVRPTGYYAGRRGRPAENEPAASIDLPPWEKSLTADADGRFALPVPVGYSVSFRVTAAGFGETAFTTDIGAELNPVLHPPGAVTIAVAGVDAAAVKGTHWHIAVKGEDNAGPGTRPHRYRSGTLDGTATQTVTGVPPGRYELTVSDDGTAPAVFVKGEPVEVVAGKTVTVAATFGPAATVTGKVVGKDTGEGIAGVQVILAVNKTAEAGRADRWLSVVTRPDGTYTAHGPAGWYSAWLQETPDGYATQYVKGGGQVKPAKVELGKPHEFPPIELLTAATLTGQVVFPDGKPAAGAKLSLGGFYPGHGDRTVTADRDGRFALKNLPPDDAVKPRARLGTAVNVPETYEVEKTTSPFTIEVSEENAAAFRGRVTDHAGKPIAGAKVSLVHHIWGVGRGGESGTSGPTATAKTDADGRYTFAGYWPKDRYSVQITAAGFADAEGKTVTADAGQTHDFGTVTLTRASLAVRGVVRDADGKPVAGAEVFGVDGPERFTTTSAADGSFTLSGYFDAPAWAFAKKAGYRLAAVPVTPGGAEPVVLTLAAADAPPAPRPEVTAEHKAALDRFTRHLLTRVWKTRVEHGYGGNVLTDMARIDVETAKKWRDEEKARPGGKDLSHLIDRAVRETTLLATAKEDIDEALAILRTAKGDAGYYDALRLGRQLLAVDQEKAARVAEELTARARQRGIPAKVWSLAEAGELAARAGNVPGGKKLLAEAADLAGKLDAGGRDLNALAVGMVAARLAPYDWPRAEALLNEIKDPGEFNRWLGNTCGRLAATDPAKAKALFDRFKPGNTYSAADARVRVAYRLAGTKPDEAEELIAGVAEGGIRFRGYVGLAVRVAKTDKARAHKVIDRAFAMLENDPEAFRSWSNFGGAGGFAAMGAVRAAEVGHPDVAGLVARALSHRPTGKDAWRPDDRQNSLVNTAAVLALIDPPTARRVLAGVCPPGEYVERAAGQRRDWLFALALADPDRAAGLVDKLLDRVKDRPAGGGNALSGTGLVELGSILTAPDRLGMLAQYASLLRELDEDDE